MKHTSSLDSSLSTVRTEGGLLPADILAKILAGDGRIPGTTAEDYHLPKGEKLNESINRAWSRVRALWEKFRLQCDSLTDTDTGTSQTRETLLLPLFAELGYGRLFSSKAEDRTVGDKVFSISHFWHHSPIHLVGCQVELDRKAKGVRGAAQSSPHSMVQDFLNRSEGHLWGFCSNGLRLRILRDNQSLSRQAFIEFDLESMFEGEVFSDFALLWLLCHQSRVESDDTATCWLEIWARSAQEQGVRALDTLRDSVRKTIEILGQGFLEHHNPDLKDRLRSGALSRQDYFRQLLRLVYRLLFLFAAEDRGLLHATGTPEDARQRYAVWHSTARLRRLATKLAGTKHHDLYECLKLIMRQLGSEDGCPELGLSPLGSFLWSDEALPDLAPARLSNEHLLRAVRALSFMEAEGLRRPVDFKNVGARELGSIYESLLELHPDLDTVSGAFILQTASGNERKTTGSYYTPTALINCLLDSALEPVIQQAMAQGDPEQAILNLKICDPASGSGHFLIAAAHRLAKRLAGVRTSDEEPGPDAMRTALRDVIGRCIYGVDLNPMAVELCKVSLWLEALEPGKPLSFLDHHIRCGNSLIGATPELIAAGLPDDAFKPIQGDDKAACTALKKRNKAAQKKSSLPFLVKQEAEVQARLRQAASTLEALPSDSLKDILAKENAFQQHESTPEFKHKKMLADAWCAAFVIPKYFPPKPGHPQLPSDEPVGITQRELNAYAMGHALPQELAHTVEELAIQYQFFHWHLAFPEVFGNGGFDVILGNPPWERTAFEDDQFFSIHLPSILSTTTTAKRKNIIKDLKTTNLEIYNAYINARRQSEGETSLIVNTRRYPLSARGRLNTYALFVELGVQLVTKKGKIGIIVQTGIATDAPMEEFWKHLVQKNAIESIFDFENRRGIFANVHRSMKFCLLTIRNEYLNNNIKINCGFYLQDVSQLKDVNSTYTLTPDVLSIINPNTNQPPVCRSQKDLELVYYLQKNHTIIMHKDHSKQTARAWRALMSAGSSQHYRTIEDLDIQNDLIRDPYIITNGGNKYIALIEAKQIHQYDPSYATYRDVPVDDRRKGNPRLVTDNERSDLSLPVPRFWASEEVVEEMFQAKDWKHKWTVGIRDVTNSTNERTAIMCILPRTGLVQPLNGVIIRNAKTALFVTAAINSFACDYIARQKTPGSHLNVTIFSQLPIPDINENDIVNTVILCSLELSYVICSLEEFAKECGHTHPHYTWNNERRFLLKCIIDAAMFVLYFGTETNWTANTSPMLQSFFSSPRQAADYIMDTFPIVKRKDEAKYGEYRTKRTILEIYDAMQHAITTGQPYQTRLDPPPADRRCCHAEEN